MLETALPDERSRVVAAAAAAAADDDDDVAVDMLATPKSMRVRLTRCPGNALTRHGESMLPQPVSSVT